MLEIKEPAYGTIFHYSYVDFTTILLNRQTVSNCWVVKITKKDDKAIAELQIQENSMRKRFFLITGEKDIIEDVLAFVSKGFSNSNWIM